MADVFVCKLPLENKPDEFVTVYSKWTDSSFSFKITHGENAWEKYVSSDILKTLSDLSGRKLEEYVSETKRALTSDGGCTEFTYSLHESEFSWKKIIDNVNNIKVKFGYIFLEKTMISSVAETIIGTLLDQCISLKKNSNTLRKENNDLITANSNLRTHVGKITRLKTEMEETIYAKMLLVLNAKKEKIAELEHQYENINSSTRNSLRKNHGTQSVEEDIESSTASDLYNSETELDSDENSDEIPSKIGRIGDSKSVTALAVEEELVPKLPKQELVSPNKLLGNICVAKSLRKEQDLEVDLNTSDISLPARSRKNIKSKFLH